MQFTIIHFLVSNVGAEQFDRTVKVFPKPAHGRINISIPQTDLPASLSLVNSTGQTIFSTVINDTDQFNEGLYVMEIFSREMIRRKVVVKTSLR